MFRCDLTLVAPTRAELEAALRQAATAADRSGRGQLLRWPLASLDAFFARAAADREGWRQWDGAAPPPNAPPPRERGRGHGREPRQPRNRRWPNHQRPTRQRRSVVVA